MSYSLVPYLVDLEKLRRVMGSKDDVLLKSVLSNIGDEDETSDDAEGDNDEDVEEDEEEEISMTRAVTDLISGNKPVDGSGHVYGYALENICNTIGTRLGADEWCGIRWEVLEATGVETLLVTSGSPVPLPEIDDFPTIGFLTLDETEKMLASVKEDGLTSAAPIGRVIKRTIVQRFFIWAIKKLFPVQRSPITQEDLKPLLEEFESWLREASAKKHAIMFFYY